MNVTAVRCGICGAAYTRDTSEHASPGDWLPPARDRACWHPPSVVELQTDRRPTWAPAVVIDVDTTHEVHTHA